MYHFNSSMVSRESTQFPPFSERCVFSIYKSAARFVSSRSEIKHEPKGLPAKFRPNFLNIYYKQCQDY